MISFTILKQSKRSAARLGILKTPHGDVETPALVPVATQAAVKTLTSEEAEATGSQVLIANTFHLHLRPGEKIVSKVGGLHRFMNWQRPLMTDSGGFQVFSLGFGTDLETGKLAAGKRGTQVKLGAQPSRIRITESGVFFRSPLNGANLFIGPQESIRIQETLGADIMFTFDECPPPGADRAYLAASLRRTHRWAKESLGARESSQALFGIIQGGRVRALRTESARAITALPFDGFGIGGEFGAGKPAMGAMVSHVTSLLPERLPRHLLGIGHPDDLATIIRAGVDTFDCTIPTHYGRRGIAFVAKGRLNLTNAAFLRDTRPIDTHCACMACTGYTRQYIAHLLRAKEMTALRLITFHNLFHFHARIAKIRRMIAGGKF